MALPKQLLKRTAERFAAEHPKKEEEEEQQEFGEAQKTKTVIKDIGEALAEFKDYATEEAPPATQSSERLEKLKAAYDAGMTPSGTNEQAGAAAAPKIIDFSNVRMTKDFTQEQRAQVNAMPVLAILGPSMAMKRTEEGEAIDVGGRMRNIPLKAHKIPTQYIKTMPSTWEPPHFDEIDQLYPLIKPFSMANLKWNPEKNHLEYYVLEPYLTLEQERQLKTIKDLVIDLLDINLFEMKEAKNIRDVLKDKVNKVVADYGIQLTKDEYAKMLYYIYREFLGMSKIEPMMHDPNIEDISCDGISIPLYIYHRKYASVPSNVQFETEEELNDFIIKIAQRCGKHISVAEPLLDGALPDGSRVQATFSSHKDIAMHGSTFTIRKFTRDPLTVTDLVKFGTVPEMMAAYLWLAIEYKKSFLVAGGTATGKTSLLNSLSMFLPEEAKIVSIEDTPEIRLPHEHWLQKVVRTGFGREDMTGRKQGEITMYDLLRAALRERPDEIIVGEVRGQEAYVLFQGMATGHAGMATIHGDSVDSVMHRLQTPPISLSAGLLQHLNIIIILTKARIKGIEVRRVKEVVEVLGLSKDQEPIVNTLFRWNPSDDTFEFASDKSYILQSIIEDKGIDEKSIWEEVQRRTRIMHWMKENDIRYYIDVGKVIQQYYKNPTEVLKNI